MKKLVATVLVLILTVVAGVQSADRAFPSAVSLTHHHYGTGPTSGCRAEPDCSDELNRSRFMTLSGNLPRRGHKRN